MTMPKSEEFEKWKETCDDPRSPLSAWRSRQPEIDALNDEVELISIARKSQNAAYEKKIDALKERIDRMQAALSATPTPPVLKGIKEVMEAVQVFASAWSLVGGPFDSGNALEEAESAKSELETILRKLIADPTQPEVEPIGYVNPRIISILNRRGSTDATIGTVKTTIYSEPLYASPLKK